MIKVWTDSQEAGLRRALVSTGNSCGLYGAAPFARDD